MAFLRKTPQTIEEARRALAIFSSPQSTARRREMHERIDYYYGEQLEYLSKLLSLQFKNPKQLKLQPEIIAVTEMLINELAVIYNEPPTRRITDGSASDTVLLETIIEQSNLDGVMRAANVFTKLCKTVLVRPVWLETKKIIEYDIYTPDVFDVTQDPSDPTKMLSVIYAVDYDFDNFTLSNDYSSHGDPFSAPNAIYMFWSNNNYFSFKASGNNKDLKIIEQFSNPNNINPYGTLPFVVIRDDVPIRGFFARGGKDLVLTNAALNIKLTEQNHLIKMQSFSQPIRKGGGKEAMIFPDPSMVIDIPADDDTAKDRYFKFETPDPKILEVAKVIEDRIRWLAIKYKLNPDMFVASGNRSSAQSLELQNYHQAKIIKADKPTYRNAETQIFELTKIIWNYHSAGQKFSETAKLKVDFKEIERPQTTEQNDMHNLTLLNNGIISKVDWILDVNPDLTSRKEATVRLMEIQKENTLISKGLKTEESTTTEEESEKEAEEELETQ